MRPVRGVALTGAAALTVSLLSAGSALARQQQPEGNGARTSYAVLAERGADVRALAQRLEGTGARVTSVNTAIGLVALSSPAPGFLARVRAVPGVQTAARDGVVGHAPRASAPDRTSVERIRGRGDATVAGSSSSPATTTRQAASEGARADGSKVADPLDSLLWGMGLIDAPAAHAVDTGDRRVKVGVIDTGIDASHPDIAPNFDAEGSRNFTTDLPDIDGECEENDCADPADVDQNGHGTHVAGTIGGALNGIGTSGVAPTVDLVSVRAGQDSGYFFLTPVVNALTYSGDAGLDVVNMSFYVDPWSYSCRGGAPEDTPEQAAEQDLAIEAMNRAVSYARAKGVTLIAALGNSHDDLAAPRTDATSPNYPGGTEHARTIDGAACSSLPVEAEHVIGVSALGPSTRKASYSNWTSDPSAGEIELSAPGGDYRDQYGTDRYATPGNLILSAAPLGVLQAAGDVDADGNVTAAGQGWVLKDCRTRPGGGPDAQECGYYQYLQGTSMAAPHVSGVAALVVSSHGRATGLGGFGLAPERTESILRRTATPTGCPRGDSVVYAGLPAEYSARCVADSGVNGFYGYGIVNALGAAHQAKPGQP